MASLEDSFPEDFSPEERAAYAAAFREITKIKRSYDRRAFDALPPGTQDQVRTAEYAAYFAVQAAASYTDPNSPTKSRLHSRDVFLDDAELIDKPLEAIANLAAAYQSSGLASNEEAAEQMADSFKTSVATMARRRGGRG